MKNEELPSGPVRPVDQKEGQEEAGGEQARSRQQSSKEFAQQQHFPSNRGEKVIVQAALDNLSAKKPGEDTEAPEEDRQAQVEELEDAGQHFGIGFHGIVSM